MRSMGLVSGLLVLALTTLAPSADDFSSWARSRNITVNTASGGAAVAGNVRGFPLLVRLDEQAFDFSQARGNGGDIRFVKSDGTTPLSYHIERWDSAAALAEIWVRMDTVYGNNSTQSFKMFWGKPSAVTTASGTDVYRTSGDFEGVWHLNESGTGTRFNQTTRPWNGLTVNYDGDEKAAGVAGSSDNLDAVNDKILVGDIDLSTGITISAWVNPATLPHWGRILDKAYAPCVSPYSIYTLHLDGAVAGRIKMSVALGSTGYTVGSSTAIPTGQWSHVAGTWDGDTVRVFVNGTQESKMAAAGTLAANDVNTLIGSNSCHDGQRFNGKIDEVQLSKAARSPDWVKLAYQTEKPGSKVVGVGEALSAWSHSATLTLNTTATGANIPGTVTQFPLLVRLTGADFNFAQARAGGADLRFSKAGGEPLAYHIERWDSAGGTAAVWVKVDTVLGNNATQSIKMYWGNSAASSRSSGPAVFAAGNGFRGVWHMNNVSSFTEETGLAAAGTNTGAANATGMIGNGSSFDVDADKITVPAYSAVEAANLLVSPATFITFSFWVNSSTDDWDALSSRRHILTKGMNTGGTTDQDWAIFVNHSTDKLTFETRSTASSWTTMTTNKTSWNANTWYHLTFVNDIAARTYQWYVNGVADGASQTYANAHVETGDASPIEFGHHVTAAPFKGTLDEMQISNVRRPADWIKLAYETQKTGSIVVVRTAVVPALQLVITSPAVDTTVGQTPFPVHYTVNGTPKVRQVALAEGLSVVVIDTVNASGVRSADTVRITLFTPPPVVVILSPATDTLVNVASISVAYTVDGVGGNLSFNLVEGANVLVVEAFNSAGRRGADTVVVTRDSQAPVVVITRPGMDTVVNTPAFTVEYTVDGVAGFQEAFTLVEGLNVLVVDSTDAAGNRGADTAMVTLDTQPPVVAFTSPLDGAMTNQNPVAVFWTVDGVPQAGFESELLVEGSNIITRSATDAAGNTASVSIVIQLDSHSPVVDITSPASDTLVSTPTITLAFTVDGVPRSRLISLSPGSNLLQVDTTDAAGNTGSDAITVGLDTQGPSVVVLPFHQQVLPALLVPLKVAYSDSGSGITLGSLRVLLDGQEITPSLTIAGDSAAAMLSTSEGSHHLSVRLVDNLGNETTLESDFTCTLPPPPLVLTAPANLSTVRTADVLVEGQIQSAVSQIRVDGLLAAVTGTGFQALVPLLDGRNTILATGFDSQGNQVSTTLTITLDREKPRIYITSPVDGAVLLEDSVVVIGSVSDRIADIQGQSMPAVKVNGLDAVVVNNTFRAVVPLTAGPNTLTAVATDEAGNLESAVANVTLDQAAQPSLAAHAGQEQSAPVYSSLPQPLQVIVRNAAGQPVSGRPVVFRVTLGDGVFAGGNRLLGVNSDAQGLASAGFTLGRRAGPGANEVMAEAEGFAGKGIFHPNAVERPAYRILTAAGDMQRGLAGNPAPQALIALVTDSAGNPVPGIPVGFKVEKGGGHFAGRNADTSVTGADGRAVASVTLGPEEGRDNNLVAATFDGNPSQAAHFVLSGYIPGPPAETRVSGVILDNSNRSLQGVTVRIEENGQQTVTDANGQFNLANTPVGVLHLHVDGTTASQPGDWVTLKFELNAISGKNNDVGMPIYLVARNNAEGKAASASQDQVVTLGQIPGFALRVPAGSATFPPDVDDHTVTVTSVHTDKIPMPPGEGMQPRFIISIGPPEVHFDPPAPITYPNVEGLKPGEQTHFYSFDHDLNAFVSIGTGTVSEDGSVITSDKGFGIVKGGWHCAGPSNPSGFAEPPKVKISPYSRPYTPIDDEVTFSAIGAPKPGTIVWSGGDVVLGASNLLSYKVKFTSVGLKTIKATWTCESGNIAVDSIKVKVSTKEVTIVGWVDSERIELPTGANPHLVGTLTDPLARFALILAWKNGNRLLLPEESDRKFANAYLLEHSGNNRPPTSMKSAAAYRDRGDYRLFCRAKLYFETKDGKIKGTPIFVEGIKDAKVGRTPIPNLPLVSSVPEEHTLNDRGGVSHGSTRTYLITQGRLGDDGQKINHVINVCTPTSCDPEAYANSTPWIYTLLRFDVEGRMIAPDNQIFPSYVLYEDGELVTSTIQADPELFIQLNGSSQIGIP